MRKGRSRKCAKVAPTKNDHKETENKLVLKEKKRISRPCVDKMGFNWSETVTHLAVWTVLTLLCTGLLICLIVLMYSVDWTVMQRVGEPSTTAAATNSTAAATTSEEIFAVDGLTKTLGSTISLGERMTAAQHLSAKQGMSSACGDNRCSVNGQCVDGVDAYTCTCDVGYYGRYCDVALSDCERLLCNSHGECRREVDTRQVYCSCTRGYTGSNCEVEPVLISSSCLNPLSSCFGNGQCIDLFEGNYICICYAGYNGTDCEVDINECDSSPCYNGNCTDLVNGFSCDCELGYEGVQCQADLDNCSAKPCPTHSACIDLSNNYTCLCDVGFTGVDCHPLCDDEPCFNNATCSLCEGGSCNGTGLPFRCNCTENGTYGVLCTDRDGYWSEWSNWVSTPDSFLHPLETDIFSAPLANCSYLNTTRSRQCVQPLSAGAHCEGSSFQEAALISAEVQCDCLLCCEAGLSCEPFLMKACLCNDDCGGSLSPCCNNRDLICSTTPVITFSDLF